jgi:hypothetical protein
VEDDLAIAPGRHRIAVAFDPVRPPQLGAPPAGEPAESSRDDRLVAAFDALGRPALTEELEFRAGRAVLVELTEDGVLRVVR